MTSTTSPAHTRLVAALEAAGCRVSNGGRAATCPAHDDRNPSLSIGRRSDGEGVLVHCHAGCDVADVLEAVKLSPRDLFDEPRNGVPTVPTVPTVRPHVVCAYLYTDEAGTVLYRKLRKSDKSFPQERPDGRGGWVRGLGAPGEVRRVLYRLPAVVAAVEAGAPVLLCEGEKDADNVTAAGWTGTTWPEGASEPGRVLKWRPEYTETLRGAHVLIVRDRDAPGRYTSAGIAAELEGVAASVVVVEPVEGKDVSDHLEAGHGMDELRPVDLAAELVEDHLDDEGDEDEADNDDEGPGASWAPVDLAETVAGLLAGTIERPAPTVGRLDDGRHLFYRGRVNGIAGASGSGKSWTALATCAQELAEGEHALYLDLEDDEVSVVSRLLILGADPAAIVARFHYIRPTEAYGPSARDRLRETLAACGCRPSVAVVDSTGEAMAADGAKPNDDDDTARWFKRLPTPLARFTGAAVVVLDHMVKAEEGGLWPIGSQRKRAAVGGAQYIQTQVQPFSQDTAGLSKLVCGKDRHGNYRAGQRVADLVVTPGETPVAVLRAHEAPTVAPGDWRPTALMERIARALEDEAAPLSFRAIDERVKGKADHKRTALRVLVDEGHVAVSDGPRNARLHELVKPYAQRSDPRSDLYRDPGTHSAPDERVSVSVSLERDTGHTHSTVSGTHSGHGGTRSHGETLAGPDEGHEVTAAADLDERPACSSCGRRMGRAEAAAGACMPCRRIAAAGGAS